MTVSDAEKNVLAALECGDKPPLELADHLIKLADLYFSNNEFEHAEPLYWRALEMVHQAVGPVHIRVACTLQDLAELYEIQAKYSKAEHLYECIIGILGDLPGEKCPEAVDSLRRIEGYYESRGLECQMANVRTLCGKFTERQKRASELSA
jgi:tetratricopeptide (TPR) repeat protein